MLITRSRPTRAFRSVVQALPAITAPKTIPGYDGLLPIAELVNDLEIKMPWWAGVETDMRLQAGWKLFNPANPNEPGDADLVGIYHTVTATEAATSTTVFTIVVPKALFAHGVYLLNIRSQTVPGNAREYTASIRIEVDTLAPGGGVLPFLKFEEPVENSGTVGDDDIVDGKLPIYLAHYEDIKRGDTITPWLNGALLPAEAVEILSAPVEGELIRLDISEQALLDAGNGVGKGVGYVVTDKAGNPASSKIQTLTLDLGAKPEGLKAPLVPRADDGVIDDADARTPVQVMIPKFDKAREGDEIEVHWGNQIADRVSLKAEDLPEDPFIGVQVPYLFVVNAGNGTVLVKYKVFRNGREVGESPVKPVVVDLTLIGGPDPDPDPEHGNLLPAKIISDSGQSNVIPPEDYGKNAKAVIAWLGKNGSEIYALNDKILFTWGDQVGSQVLRTVQQSDIDAKVDLELSIPAITITTQGSGRIPVFYTASRLTSVPPFENVSLAPKEIIPVTSQDELPGEGTIAPPTFPVLNEFDAIGPNELINGSEGPYNPVRVATDYTHVKVGDSIELFFVGYDQLIGGSLIPEAAYNPQPAYTLVLADITRTYYEFRVPAQYHYAVCSRGGVEAHVIVTNEKGSTTSLPKRVFCDVKEPSWEDCKNKP